MAIIEVDDETRDRLKLLMRADGACYVDYDQLLRDLVTKEENWQAIRKSFQRSETGVSPTKTEES